MIPTGLSKFFSTVRAFHGLELGVALALLYIGFRLFDVGGQAVDENVHYDQIVRLATGRWSSDRSVNPLAPSMLPGFHAIVAGLVWATGQVSESSVRLTVFLLSVATVGAFHALARTLQPEQAGTRTLQFTLLPILFPQFFLIYTDVTSLLFVLLMMLATAQRRYWAAGVLGLVSCVVRQNNVIWILFAVLWSYVRDHGWTWKPLSQSLTRYWTFVATGVVFLLFIVLNGGEVALGRDAGKHPLGVYVTNIFFLLFLSGFLFLPLWWGYRRDVLASLSSHWPWLSLLGLFLIFWFVFANDHPDNNKRPEFFLRNAILMLFSSTTILKLLFFVPVAVSALCMTAVPMKKPWWLLYPFTILFLLPKWLVEQRYYLIPLSLFLLAREPTAMWSERFQTALFLIGSAALFLMVTRMGMWM